MKANKAGKDHFLYNLNYGIVLSVYLAVYFPHAIYRNKLCFLMFLANQAIDSLKLPRGVIMLDIPRFQLER